MKNSSGSILHHYGIILIVNCFSMFGCLLYSIPPLFMPLFKEEKETLVRLARVVLRGKIRTYIIMKIKYSLFIFFPKNF